MITRTPQYVGVVNRRFVDEHTRIVSRVRQRYHLSGSFIKDALAALDFITGQEKDQL